MNKKVLTLCAGLVLAGSMNVWAQSTIELNGTLPSGNTGYAVQSATAGLSATKFIVDDASSTSTEFPKVSPFALNVQYGAKPIAELQHVDGQSDGRYFQFAVGQTFSLNGTNVTTSNGNGTEILTMVWVAGANNTEGHFELQVENVNNANIPANEILLDRTLWKVTAHKDQVGGTTLYYELQNKATQAILQLGRDNVVAKPAGATVKQGSTDVEAQEIALEIMSGQTNWRWAAAEKSAVNSVIASGYKVLKNPMSAQYDNNTTVHLAKKIVTKGSTTTVTLGAIKMNSSLNFAAAGDRITISYTEAGSSVTETYLPITFEGWEANPIILTADQINAELGNEVELTADQKTPNKFHFDFSNDVEGTENVMMAYDFKAVKADDGFSRVPGDAPDGYVRFQNANNAKEYLYVDTAYHDASANAQYALQLTVDQITYPRGAVQTDGRTIDANGNINVGAVDFYKGDVAPYTSRAYVQMKRQSNFRPIFYPATQSLRLQAEMIYRADKRSSEPWWKQMGDDAMYATSSQDATGKGAGNGDYMRIAGYAANPAGVNPVNNPEKVRGYYPSYTQNIQSNGNIAQGLRLIHYAKSWLEPKADLTQFNGYAPGGAYDYTISGSTATDKMFWNAVGNVLIGNSTATKAQDVSKWGSASAIGTNNTNVWVLDPAITTSGSAFLDYITNSTSADNKVTTGTTPAVDAPTIFAPQYALAHSNLVRITTLNGGQRALTADVHDMIDEEYNGLNTFITIRTVKTESGLEEVAEIQPGFYYIRNANKKNADLVQENDYRYEDLAATNAMFGYWNSDEQRWDKGFSAVDGEIDLTDNQGVNTEAHKNDKANIGNLVYSEDKKVIPSAQWYITGTKGNYTIINRESGREWGTSNWWNGDEPGVYVNLATYTDATGLKQNYRDTIRIEAIPASELNDPHMGYLWVESEELKADTVNYGVGMTMAGATFTLTEDENGLLKLSQAEDAKGDYKLERVFLKDKDNYSQATKPTDEFYYGYLPENTNGIDSTRLLLTRAMYYIYKDDVSANTGTEETSIKTRQYITLDGGKYKLTSVKVKLNADGSSDNMEVEEILTPNSPNARRAFYIKQISTVEPNQFVLVDPAVVTQTQNGTSTKVAYGARLFLNQNTAEIQPSSLISDGASNAYAASIFNIDKKQAYNYIDIRPAGVARDTVEFYSTKTDGQYLLSENADGLLESLDARLNKNNSLFLDTANVQNPEFPRFYLGLRSKDSVEVSNLDNHNRHIFTEADYLINMVDSAKTNSAYVYKNQAFNNTDCYRLGFIRARHHVDGRLEFLGKTTFQPLAKEEMNIATYAFRYANADRNPNEFYIETMYDANTKGWLATINHVLVVTPDIQQAEVFSMNTEVTDDPTANETIAAEGAVSVVATDGAVIVKGAEGKNVVIATILGKVVANETVNSDNETIAVPAGIAVVSVDGESFKVVVK